MQFQWADVLAFMQEAHDKVLYKLTLETDEKEMYRLQGEIRRFRWFGQLPELMVEAAQKEREGKE